jgi:hypothetical protein
MVDLEEVRRMALALPEASAEINAEGWFGAGVAGKGFAWTWMERIAPKRPRVPCPGVLAVRVADLEEKEALLASDDRVYFTEPHYNGFPAVLVRLAEVEPEELRALLTEAWRSRAPKKLVKESGL